MNCDVRVAVHVVRILNSLIAPVACPDKPGCHKMQSAIVREKLITSLKEMLNLPT